MDPDRARRGLPHAAGAAPVPGQRWPARVQELCRAIADHYGNDAEPRLDRGERRARTWRPACWACRGSAPMKARTVLAIVGSGSASQPPGWEAVAADPPDARRRRLARVARRLPGRQAGQEGRDARRQGRQGLTRMDEKTQRALSRGHRIDITTTGRRTHQPRRIEIVFHNIDGRIYISGSPTSGRAPGSTTSRPIRI